MLSNNLIPLQKFEKPASGQNKVRADGFDKLTTSIFSGFLAVCLFASASRRGGRKGGLGGIPPAEPINEIGSDIFKYTPPVRKCSVWQTSKEPGRKIFGEMLDRISNFLV